MIINEMASEIYELHKHRLSTIEHPWLNFKQMVQHVYDKGCCLTNCWGFLDESQLRICRPGDGQESIYNGHKRQHSLKYQSLMLSNGIIAQFWGLFKGRHHDSAMYFFSGLDVLISEIYDSNEC